jgi:hypothetical protein
MVKELSSLGKGNKPLILIENIKKQAKFETPKFNKSCNCIEMTRKEITWVKGDINYNHKMSLGALKNLIKKMKDYSKPLQYTLSPIPKATAT